jgi:hypothetical protein
VSLCAQKLASTLIANPARNLFLKKVMRNLSQQMGRARRRVPKMLTAEIIKHVQSQVAAPPACDRLPGT